MRLFLCEKPSQGKDIAKVLGATRRGDGCLMGDGVMVTWCIGHLLESAPPEHYGVQYKQWSIEQLPILPPTWQVAVKAGTATQFKIVKKLLGQATSLVIATDADREGEMIAREIMEHCNYQGPVFRLWLSALNEASIRKALGSLKPGAETLPLYYAALSRSRADWLVGMNFSRLFTLLGQRAGYSGVLSVGRVQTPTLGLVVRRDREIAAFVPKPYWSIDVRLTAGAAGFVAQWQAQQAASDEEGRCIQQSVAQQALARIQPPATAQVISIETERLREAPPLAFSLSTLQETCSRRFGMDVQETLDVAQALYETHKATTYPRTDTGYLPESMLAEVPQVLKSLAVSDPGIQSTVSKLDTSLQSRIWNDKKITAHHGIIPTLEPANLSALSQKERQVYELIRSHYLAQFLPVHEYDRTVSQLQCEGESLTATGKQIVVVGWRSLFGSDDGEGKEARSQVLPALTEGMRCTITGAELRTLKTLPPKPYTQGDLINAMKGVARFVEDPRLKQTLKETTGIGTEATRAGIIKGLMQRGYLVEQGKTLHATPAAVTLIDAVPAAIADPGMTALWEQALDAIEQGQMPPQLFLEKQSQWIAQLVRQYAGTSLSMNLPTAPACPQCQAPMRQRSGKNGAFWACSRYPDCRATAPMDGKKAPVKKKSSRRKKPAADNED